jgi:pyruvate dehydrogenase E1 component alpha subunit
LKSSLIQSKRLQKLLENTDQKPFSVLKLEDPDLLELGISEDMIVSVLKTMILNRILDGKILSLQRQGRLGAYIASTGEEGAIIGSAFAMIHSDWLFSSYRELGAHLVRGLSVDLVLAQLYGNSNDLLKGRQMSNSWGSKQLNSVTTAAPIGAYLPVAVGTAMASKIRHSGIAVLAYLGDGGTSASDFHVAMNFAGVYRTPMVFFCRNNGWAISLPVKQQTASKSLATKATAYGFKGIRVDGNDALAAYVATGYALEKARAGNGPSFIEALTYRMGPHSTADDPTRYRTDSEVANWTDNDPIKLMKLFAIKRKVWDEKTEAALVEDYSTQISEAIHRQESIDPLPPEKLIFDDVYADVPWNLIEQRKEMIGSSDQP